MCVDCGLLVALLLIAGCDGNNATVSGTVFIDGAPIDNGRVVFHKEGQAPAIANIAEDGTFSLAIGKDSGMSPGQYKVTVASYRIGSPARAGDPPPAKLTTPRQYVDVTTTPITEVVVRGKNVVELQLVSD